MKIIALVLSLFISLNVIAQTANISRMSLLVAPLQLKFGMTKASFIKNLKSQAGKYEITDNITILGDTANSSHALFTNLRFGARAVSITGNFYFDKLVSVEIKIKESCTVIYDEITIKYGAATKISKNISDFNSPYSWVFTNGRINLHCDASQSELFYYAEKLEDEIKAMEKQKKKEIEQKNRIINSNGY